MSAIVGANRVTSKSGTTRRLGSASHVMHLHQVVSGEVSGVALASTPTSHRLPQSSTDAGTACSE